MNNHINELGKNAGKIWQTLYNNGTLISQSKLQRKTSLSDQEFHGAIGWLARENKIKKIGITYQLGSTNLTSKIGTNAGKIWKTLASTKEADITTIMKQTGMRETDAHSAIGWLARENKIDTQIGKNDQLFFRLR
jgi:hypothetical protein